MKMGGPSVPLPRNVFFNHNSSHGEIVPDVASLCSIMLRKTVLSLICRSLVILVCFVRGGPRLAEDPVSSPVIPSASVTGLFSRFP